MSDPFIKMLMAAAGGNNQHVAALAATRIQKLIAERDAARSEADALRDILRRNGFVECDIPACNCGSWHARYGLPERWDEIKSDLAEAGFPLTNENGHVARKALAALIAEAEALRLDAERYRFIRNDPAGFEITVAELNEDDWETWVAGYPAAELDAAIDAAMKAKP